MLGHTMSGRVRAFGCSALIKLMDFSIAARIGMGIAGDVSSGPTDKALICMDLAYNDDREPLTITVEVSLSSGRAW